MWALLLGLALALDLGDASGHKHHRHHHAALVATAETRSREPTLHLHAREHSDHPAKGHLSRHLRRLLDRPVADVEHVEPPAKRAPVAVKPLLHVTEDSTDVSDDDDDDLDVDDDSDDEPAAYSGSPATSKSPDSTPAEVHNSTAKPKMVDLSGANMMVAPQDSAVLAANVAANVAAEPHVDAKLVTAAQAAAAAVAHPVMRVFAKATPAKDEAPVKTDAVAPAIDATPTVDEAAATARASTDTSVQSDVSVAATADTASAAEVESSATAVAETATDATVDSSSEAIVVSEDSDAADAEQETKAMVPDAAPLDQDFSKEDLPYQEISKVLEKFPLLASSPLWNLVNPSALASHDPPVLDMPLKDLEELMSPAGQGLAAAFPDLRLRQLPVLEWMPNRTLPAEWSNPVDVAMPGHAAFFPDDIARTSLQDLRLRDLLSVADRKRSVWGEEWKEKQSEKGSDASDLASQVKELKARLSKATSEHAKFLAKLADIEAEHASLVASKEELEKKFEEDQKLIVEQETERLAGVEVRAGLGSKITDLEQIRKEQAQQLASLEAQLATKAKQVASAKQVAAAKLAEISELLSGKAKVEQALRDAQSKLNEDSHIKTELKEVEVEDEQLRSELNATLADEAAEARTNAALNAEVATLAAENRRLAGAELSKHPVATA